RILTLIFEQAIRCYYHSCTWNRGAFFRNLLVHNIIQPFVKLGVENSRVVGIPGTGVGSNSFTHSSKFCGTSKGSKDDMSSGIEESHGGSPTSCLWWGIYHIRLAPGALPHAVSSNSCYMRYSVYSIIALRFPLSKIPQYY